MVFYHALYFLNKQGLLMGILCYFSLRYIRLTCVLVTYPELSMFKFPLIKSIFLSDAVRLPN